MPQKKITKKPKNKKSTSRSTSKVFTLDRMERDFRDMPFKIMAQIRKEFLALKKEESKLSKTIQAGEKKLNSEKNKYNKLNEKAQKPNAQSSLKKQVLMSQKICDKHAKVVAELTKKLHAIRNAHDDLSFKQSAFSQLNKTLDTWSKQSKQKATPNKKTGSSKQESQPSFIHSSSNNATRQNEEFANQPEPETSDLSS